MLRFNSALVERFGSDWKENSGVRFLQTLRGGAEHALRRFWDARALRRRGKCSTVRCRLGSRCVDDS